VGDEIITIDIREKKNTWLKVFKEAQHNVQKMVKEHQLAIEVNPTSNRVIGPMEKMADHPIFKLTLDKQQHLEREIRVTINTDDPGVFSTSLPHEYYLLGEILVNRGVPEPEVVRWLDWLRKNGKDHSFLHVLPDAKNKHMEAVIQCILNRYTPMLRRLNGEPRRYIPPKERTRIKPDKKNEFQKLQKKYQQLEDDFKTISQRLEILEGKS